MKRVYAFILLIPMLAFMAESMRLPSECGEAGKARKANCGKMHDNCKEAVKTRHQEKPLKNKDESRSCWMGCPLCRLVTFKPFIRFEFDKPAARMEYIVMRENILSEYFKRHWKPPAPCFLS